MSAKIAASLVAAVALLAAPGAAGAAVTAPVDPGPDAEFVPGQLLVRFDAGVGMAESSALAADQGAEVLERYGIVPRLALVDLPPGLGVAAAERRFGALDDVSFAQPNRIYHSTVMPTDPFFATAPNALWGLDNVGQLVPHPGNPPLTNPPFAPATGGIADADIDAPEAWDLEQGEPAVTVGVIDSGITAAHEDLTGNFVDGMDFVENDNTPDDASGHGTHVAGTVGAEGNNTVGVTGVAWDVGLAGLKAGSADGRLYTDTILDAIEYADAEGIPIVNGSYTGGGEDGPFDPMRIAYANAADTLFVVAAGNSAFDVDGGNDAFPCEYSLPNIVCVAATTPSDGLASFSNFGVKGVDVGAPGTNILSTDPAFAGPVFEDDFEDTTLPLDKWVVEGGNWAASDESPKIGDHALTDSPGGPYGNNENTSIRTKDPIDLTGLDSCRLSMASAFTLGSGDSLQVEFTTATPPTNDWDPLYRGATPYTGNGVFAFRNLDLDMAGATGQNVHIRFRLFTNSFGVADGVHLDDIKVECVDAAPGAQSTYRVRQGTSMASPVVAGVAALVLSNDLGHDLTVEELRNTLLASVDPLPSLKCRTTTGGRVNAKTALDIDPATAGAAPAPSCGTSVTPPPTVVTPVPAPDPVKKKAKKKCKQKSKAKRKKCKRKQKRR